MNRIKTLIAIGLILSIITLSCKKESLTDTENTSASQNKSDARIRLSNSVIIEWSNTAWEVAGGAAEGHPLLASRIEAMMHIAMHDALNTIIPVYERYAYHEHL